MSHKLGSVRITGPDHDSRDRAVYLAACLATNKTQRADAKKQAYALLGAGQEAGFWAAKALQQLDDSLNDDIGFLTGQSWPFRSVAAIAWAKTGVPTYLGTQLADDPDVRVGRAFAAALGKSDIQDFQTPARTRLAQDPCHSVRAVLRNEYDGT